MMLRYHNAKAISSPPESRFLVLQTKGIIRAGIFNQHPYKVKRVDPEQSWIYSMLCPIITRYILFIY